MTPPFPARRSSDLVVQQRLNRVRAVRALEDRRESVAYVRCVDGARGVVREQRKDLRQGQVRHVLPLSVGSSVTTAASPREERGRWLSGPIRRSGGTG